MKRLRFDNSGFSIIGMIAYVAILSFLLVVIAGTVVSVTKSFRHLKTAQRIERDAVSILERIVRGARQAESFGAGSIFGSNPGALELLSRDDAGVAHSISFVAQNGRIMLTEDGAEIGFLSSDKSEASSVIFKEVASARGHGLKIELTLRSPDGNRSENFYSTVGLRNSK